MTGNESVEWVARPAPFFQGGPAAEDYALIRDHSDPEVAATRNSIEDMWVAFAPHADPNFRDDAMNNFRGRFWELYLFTLLRSAGLSPRGQPNGGPDFVLGMTPSTRASVEATAATVGQGADQVPEEKYNEVVEVPKRELLLRLTAAMDEKCRKATHYLDRGLLRAEEPFAIAINGAVSSYATIDCRTPEGFRVPRILQVLFGIGDYSISIDDEGQVRSRGFNARPSIPKLNGAGVASALFRTDAIAYVSCVIFGLEYARSFDISGQNLLLVHNPHARNPWPRGLLRRGVEYWVEGTKLRWTEWHTQVSNSGPSTAPPPVEPHS